MLWLGEPRGGFRKGRSPPGEGSLHLDRDRDRGSLWFVHPWSIFLELHSVSQEPGEEEGRCSEGKA